LRQCTPAEAAEIFSRYADHVTCKAALANPDPEVQQLALTVLKEFANAGDPFAVEILARLKTPPR
jgi:hypothetical protein